MPLPDNHVLSMVETGADAADVLISDLNLEVMIFGPMSIDMDFA